jgi:Skp family chaperone for outer membrane proteins
MSMLDEAQPSAERRDVQPTERIGIVNVRRLGKESKLGKRLQGRVDANPAAEFQRHLGPVISEFAREASLRLLFSAADSGIVWSDPRLDATSAVVGRLDKATDRKAPVPIPWPEPPPAVFSYVRLRVLGERAELARESTAAVERLSEKVASGRASVGDRRELADAEARLKREILAEVAALAERECRARGITLLLSMGDSGILDADGAIDLTETLLKALGQR